MHLEAKMLTEGHNKLSVTQVKKDVVLEFKPVEMNHVLLRTRNGERK